MLPLRRQGFHRDIKQSQNTAACFEKQVQVSSNHSKNIHRDIETAAACTAHAALYTAAAAALYTAVAAACMAHAVPCEVHLVVVPAVAFAADIIHDRTFLFPQMAHYSSEESAAFVDDCFGKGMPSFCLPGLDIHLYASMVVADASRSQSM